MDIFSHIFKMVTPRVLRQLLLFIALNYLTSVAFIANLRSHLIPVHYKTSTTCTSKRTVLNSMIYIDKIHKVASNNVFSGCDWGADPDCTIINLCQLDMKNFRCHLLLDKLLFNIVDQWWFSSQYFCSKLQKFYSQRIFLIDLDCLHSQQLLRIAGLTMGLLLKLYLSSYVTRNTQKILA